MRTLFSIKFALIKRYYLHMCNRVLLLLRKMPQWNLYVNCHVNGTTFQRGLRFQTGLSSLRVSYKRALTQNSQHLMFLRPFLILEYPLILEIHLKLFEKQHISFVKKAFLIYKKDKALKTGRGDRAHLRTPPPHTHTHTHTHARAHTYTRACTCKHTLRPGKGN